MDLNLVYGGHLGRLALAIFTAEPGSRSEEALGLLASWAATPEHEPAAPAPDVPAPLTAADSVTPSRECDRPHGHAVGR